MWTNKSKLPKHFSLIYVPDIDIPPFIPCFTIILGNCLKKIGGNTYILIVNNCNERRGEHFYYIHNLYIFL